MDRSLTSIKGVVQDTRGIRGENKVLGQAIIMILRGNRAHSALAIVCLFTGVHGLVQDSLQSMGPISHTQISLFFVPVFTVINENCCAERPRVLVLSETRFSHALSSEPAQAAAIAR